MIAFFWALAAAFIVVLLVFFQEHVDYAFKRCYLLGNFSLIIIGVGILSSTTYLWSRYGDESKLLHMNLDKVIAKISVLIFFLQGYIFWNIYFLTDWDVETLVNASLALIEGSDYWVMYYSYYPNNLVITWILKMLLQINQHIGWLTEPIFFIILFQCALSCIAGYLLFLFTKDLTNLSCGFFAWGIYVVHIALSPWLTIPYSDAMGLIFPILLLRMYQGAQKEGKGSWRWGGLGALGLLGYKIKPQCLIILIAIFAIEGVKIFHSGKIFTVRKYKKLLIMLTGGLLMLFFCSCLLIPSLGIPVDSEKEIGTTHFMMMGLNTESDGTWSGEDVAFSNSFATKQERAEGNIAVIKSRLQDMGIHGFLEHIVKKTLVNFADGTYSWAMEGTFYKTLFEERNTVVSPFLRSIFYSYGDNFQYFAVVEHGIWVTMLFCSIGCVFYFQNKKRDSLCVESVVILTLIGATLFQTIFEARNRYFFVNAPLFIIAAVIGWCGFCEMAKAIICKARSGNEKGVQTYE